MPIEIECALCGHAEIESSGEFEVDGLVFKRVDCPRCGVYEAGRDTYDALRQTRHNLVVPPRLDRVRDKLHLLSGLTRENSLRGGQPFQLLDADLASLLSRAPSRLADRLDRLLLNIAGISAGVGSVTELNVLRDYPLGFCKGRDEFLTLLFHLRDLGHLTPRTQDSFEITVPGWQRVEELQRSLEARNQAFVAMSFASEHRYIFDAGIGPTIESLGIAPIRIDEKEHVNRIDDEIMVEIGRSRFVVADFTGSKHGVYFEAGYALGMGVPVIWTCSEKSVNDLHFDIRQYNQILWRNLEELKERLRYRIESLFLDSDGSR